ncbi:MAG: hypothetical protein LBO03_09225 [Acidaminococcales bacterium]|nr:hypothetical protein [Acidaminococcales bacterium]
MPKVSLESNAPAIEYRPPNMALAKGAPEGFAVEAQGHKQAASEWGDMARLGAKAFQAGLAMERERESQRAIEADNAYILRMDKVRREIFDTMKGSKSEGALAVYETKEREAFRETYGASGIKYKAGQLMFENLRMRSFIQNRQAIDRWRSGQLDEAALANVDNSVSNALNFAMETGTADGFRAFVAQTRMVTAEGLLRFAPEKQEALSRDLMTKAVAGYVTGRVRGGDWSGARAALAEAAPFVDRGALANLGGLVDAYEKANNDQAENARIYVKYNGNLAAALADIGQGDAVGEPEAGWAVAPTAKVDNLKLQAKAGLGAVARLLKNLGAPGVYVTSGTDSSHAEGQYSHKNGYKVDIGTTGPGQADWFDDPANRKRFVEAAAQDGIAVRDEWEDTGDANWTGPHMDVSFAGYKGGGSSFSAARREERVDSIVAYFEGRSRLKAIVMGDVKNKALNRFFELRKSGGLNDVSVLDVVSSLVSSANLPGEDKTMLERELTGLAASAAKTPDTSNTNVWYRLQALSLQGLLGVGDVEEEIALGNLSEFDAKKFLGEALKIRLDEEDKPDKLADAAWQEYAKLKITSGYELERFTQNMTYLLDSEGARGDARRERAVKALDYRDSRSAVVDYMSEGAAQRKAAVELFGQQGGLISDLVSGRLADMSLAQGRRRSYVSDYDAARELQKIKDLLDEGARGNDPFYQEALDGFLEKGIPFSAAGLKAARDILAGEREDYIVPSAGYGGVPRPREAQETYPGTDYPGDW